MISLQFLGCSSGIGGAAYRTTCYLLDERILIDAGSGLDELSLEQLASIDHVVLTPCPLWSNCRPASDGRQRCLNAHYPTANLGLA